ncbi:MAG: tetratricopeptide repeat protein [Lacipirellulaceae bacterium]
MIRRSILASLAVAFVSLLLFPIPCFAEGPGQHDFDEALRTRITGEGMRDLNGVIELLQSALDKGLDMENTEFAETMLSSAQYERATVLVKLLGSGRVNPQQSRQLARMAISDLRTVLAYDDPPKEARLMLGKLLANPGGDPAEARRLLDKFLKSAEIDEPTTEQVDSSEGGNLPEEPEVITDSMKAEALALRGSLQRDPGKAMADFDAAVKLDPDNLNFGVARATFLRTQKRYQESLDAVEQLLEEHKENIPLQIFQGEVLRRLDKNEEALAVFDAIDEQKSDLALVYQNRGEIYRQMNDLDEALRQYSKVIELQPNSLFTLIQRAEIYFSQGKSDEAMADVDAVLEKSPNQTTAFRLKAEILANNRQVDEAIDIIQQAIAASPNQPELKMQLANYFYLSAKPKQAIEAYTEVLQAFPENYLALRSRGDAHLNLGDHASAVVDFQKAYELRQDDSFLLNNYAWLLATSPDEEVRNGKLAIELATKACEIEEYKAGHILSTLAAAYAETGDFEKAKEWSNKAIEVGKPEQLEELKKELEKYKQNQPMRERQTVEQLKEQLEEAAKTIETEPVESTDAAVAE